MDAKSKVCSPEAVQSVPWFTDAPVAQNSQSIVVEHNKEIVPWYPESCVQPYEGTQIENEKEDDVGGGFEARSSGRSNYNKYSPEDRYIIGKYAAQHGNSNACKYFADRYAGLKESTVRAHKNKYIEQFMSTDSGQQVPEEAAFIMPKKRGRPPKKSNNLMPKMLHASDLHENIQNFTVRALPVQDVEGMNMDEYLQDDNGQEQQIGEKRGRQEDDIFEEGMEQKVNSRGVEGMQERVLSTPHNQVCVNNIVIPYSQGSEGGVQVVTEEQIIVFESDQQIRVIRSEYESSKVEDTYDYSVHELQEMRFPDNKIVGDWIPVKCYNQKYKIYNGSTITYNTVYIHGWLHIPTDKVYFVGNKGQLQCCARRQFAALGGKKHQKKPNHSIQTNFDQDNLVTLQQYGLFNNVQFGETNRSNKKQKTIDETDNNFDMTISNKNLFLHNQIMQKQIQDSFLNKLNNDYKSEIHNMLEGEKFTESLNEIAQIDLSNQQIEKENAQNQQQIDQSYQFSQKHILQIDQTFELSEENKLEIKKMLEDEKINPHNNRGDLAEKIFDQFKCEQIKRVVWCDHHGHFRWVRKERGNFFCPDCVGDAAQYLEDAQYAKQKCEEFKSKKEETKIKVQKSEKVFESLQTEFQKLQVRINQAEIELKKNIMEFNQFEEGQLKSQKQIDQLTKRSFQCQELSTQQFDF